MIVSLRGYTLVEVLVALLLLDVGLLALAGAMASVVRLVGDATLAGQAAVAVETRRELFWSEQCGSGSGSSSDGLIDVAWDVSSNGPTAALVVTVMQHRPRGTSVDTVAARCES